MLHFYCSALFKTLNLAVGPVFLWYSLISFGLSLQAALSWYFSSSNFFVNLLTPIELEQLVLGRLYPELLDHSDPLLTLRPIFYYRCCWLNSAPIGLYKRRQDHIFIWSCQLSHKYWNSRRSFKFCTWRNASVKKLAVDQECRQWHAKWFSYNGFMLETG